MEAERRVCEDLEMASLEGLGRQWVVGDRLMDMRAKGRRHTACTRKTGFSLEDNRELSKACYSGTACAVLEDGLEGSRQEGMKAVRSCFSSPCRS